MGSLRRLACFTVLALAATAPASATAEPVRPADDFVESIGVNVHMTYLDTVYRQRARLVDKLSQAGIRHVRDGLSWDTQYAYDTFNQMAARGIHTTFIMGDPTESRDTLEELLTVLRTKVPGAAAMVEGPNEFSYSGRPNWAAELRAYQARLYESIKGNPATRHLPVLAPSQITWQDHAAVGDLRSALDFGNKHPYPGGDIPEANLTNELEVAARMSGDRPVYVTESGYHNALATTSGHRPASEDAVAVYLPRMYLEYFRRGIPRTFAYELIDEWPDAGRTNLEANFGLLRNDYSEKPSYRSVSNLIALLSDAGDSHPVRPLDFSVAGAPADLRKLVLQKRDGSHYIVLWRAVRVWDPVARRPVTADSRAVTVQIDDAVPAGTQAEVYAPVRSRDVVATTPADQPIALSLGAEPIVLRIGSSTPTADGGANDTSTSTGAATTFSLPPSGQPRVTVPARQTVSRVLRRGLVVKCWTTATGTCRASATASGRSVVGKGRAALEPRRTTRVTVRLTSAGKRLLKRAAKRRRSVVLRLRADFGRGRVVSGRVKLR